MRCFVGNFHLEICYSKLLCLSNLGLFINFPPSYFFGSFFCFCCCCLSFSHGFVLNPIFSFQICFSNWHAGHVRLRVASPWYARHFTVHLAKYMIIIGVGVCDGYGKGLSCTTPILYIYIASSKCDKEKKYVIKVRLEKSLTQSRN